MTDLQTTFYIIGIVYMGLSLIIIVGVLIALGVIRKKIISIEHTIKSKLDMVTTIGERAGEVISTVKKITKHKSN